MIFYKQRSCEGCNVKSGLKFKQLSKANAIKFGWTLIKQFNFFNFKFTEAKFLHKCLDYKYLEQILVTIEKMLILHIVAFMPLQIAKYLLSNFWPWKRKFAKQPWL